MSLTSLGWQYTTLVYYQSSLSKTDTKQKNTKKTKQN